MAPQEVINGSIVSKFQVLARGAGGIEELSSELPEDDSSVVWGLVTCIIGSGTFARTKYVKVNLSGAKCAHARTCTHAHTHTRTHARTHSRTHARTHARVRVLMLMRGAATTSSQLVCTHSILTPSLARCTAAALPSGG